MHTQLDVMLVLPQVPTHGLLNIVAAPHLGDASTYAATSITDGNAAAAAIAATLAAMPAVTGHVAGRGVEVPQSDTDRRAAGRAAAGGEPGLQHGKQRVGAHMTGTDTVSEADVTKKSWEGEAGTDEAAGGDVLGEQAAGDGRGNGDTGRSLHTGGRGKARGGLHAGREGRAGLGGDAGAEAGQGLGKQKMSLIAPGSSLPAIHAINSSQVEEVTRKLTAVVRCTACTACTAHAAVRVLAPSTFLLFQGSSALARPGCLPFSPNRPSVCHLPFWIGCRPAGVRAKAWGSLAKWAAIPGPGD